MSKSQASLLLWVVALVVAYTLLVLIPVGSGLASLAVTSLATSFNIPPYVAFGMVLALITALFRFLFNHVLWMN